MSNSPLTTVALVLPAKGTLSGAHLTIGALERQTVRPAETLVLCPPRADVGGHGSVPRTVAVVADAVRTAAELGDPWLWLVNSGVVPEPTALEHLLSALADMDPRPVLLSSRVLAPDGRLATTAAPVPASHLRADQVLAALGHRCLAIRVARSGSLLVHGPALSQVGFMSANSLIDRDIEWTARMLGRSQGLLVPSSVAIQSPDGRPLPLRSAYARVAASIRMLGGLEPEDDRLWFAVHLAERGLTSVLRRIQPARGRSRTTL